MDINIEFEKSEEGFSRLLSEYGRTVNKVCYMYASCVEDYEDMRQETYVNLWRGLGGFRGDADTGTWVYRVALNSCVSFFRKNRRAGEMTPLSVLTDVAVEGGDRGEMLAEMHCLINRLDGLEKAMILLWLDEYPYDEIAKVMTMPRNTVASRLKRIKEKLVRYANE